MIGAEANVPASTKFINVFEQMMEFNFLEFAGRLFEESADRGEDFFDGLVDGVTVIKEQLLKIEGKTKYLVKDGKYLGKSKANINDLFKTENEE